MGYGTFAVGARHVNAMHLGCKIWHLHALTHDGNQRFDVFQSFFIGAAAYAMVHWQGGENVVENFLIGHFKCMVAKVALFAQVMEILLKILFRCNN